MYKCEECGMVFDEPIEFVVQDLEHFGTPCQETAYGCPKCKGTFEEANICKICGKYTLEEEYCDECRSRVKGQFKKLMKMYFTKEEQNLIFQEEFD